MKIKTLFFLLALLMAPALAMAQAPKREFRGAWIQCVNGQFQGMTAQKMQSVLTSQLDALEKADTDNNCFKNYYQLFRQVHYIGLFARSKH